MEGSSEPIYQPLESFDVPSPKALRYYKLLLAKSKEGMPYDMLGDNLLGELGELIEVKDGRVYPDMRFIAYFFEKTVRARIGEEPSQAQAIVLDVFNQIEDIGPNPLAERIFYGLLKAIDDPISLDGEETEIEIIMDENTKRFEIVTNRKVKY